MAEAYLFCFLLLHSLLHPGSTRGLEQLQLLYYNTCANVRFLSYKIMGKIKIRINKSKGKRWIKGHSCVSNPQNNKHRDEAKARLFYDTFGQNPTGSSLTCDAVRKHELAVDANTKLLETHLTLDEETKSEGGETFNTFASEWTNCSNISFKRLLNGFQTNNAQHKEMLAVLAAVTEVIKSQGGTETANEYFGALLTALTVSQTEDSTTAIVALIAMVIKQVSHNILRVTFNEVSKTLMTILDQYSTFDNAAMCRQILGCLSVLLRAQEVPWFQNNTNNEAFQVLLAYVIHLKPKVRKFAQHAVAAILKHRPADTVHPAAGKVGDYCISLLDSEGTTCVLQTLGFLKGIISFLPKTQIKACCEKVLSVMSIGRDPTISLCGLQVLHAMMIMHPPSSVLPPKLNAQLINALYDFQPALADSQPMLVWFSLMHEAFNNLAKNDRELCLANVSRFSKIIAELLLCDKPVILSGAALALKVVILECLGDDLHDSTIMADAVHQILDCLHACLKFQYHHAWKYIIHVLGAMYKVAGAVYPQHMTYSLQMLASLREGDKFALAADVDKAVGCAVRSMGPRAVLKVIPLQLEAKLFAIEHHNERNFDFPRSWLLPVLRENIVNAELAFFTQYIHPLANSCKMMSENLAEEKECIVSHSLELVYSQLWSLFSSFCHSPSDLKQSFKALAKLLGMALRDNKELRIDVMSGLRRLVTFSIDKEDESSEMSRYTKNYLPILLNIYTTVSETGGRSEEQGHRLAALETIKVYLQVTSPDMCYNLFDLAFEKLTAVVTEKSSKKKSGTKSNDLEAANRDALLQLLAVLLSYQNDNRVLKLYNQCPLLLCSTDHKDQKRGYRVIEELCRAESKVCKAFVQQNVSTLVQLLTDSLATTKPPSRAPRLRCVLLLLDHMGEEHKDSLQIIVPEAILCCKDINSKCRNTAFSLLLHIGKILQKWSGKEASDVVRDYLALILPGLQGSVVLIGATMLALASLIHEYGDIMSEDVIEMLLFNVLQLLVTNVREVVGSCLSFLKAFLSIYDAKAYAPHVPSMVQSLVNMNQDCKLHFRLKCRDLLVKLVRRHGMQYISALVPEEDVTMHKRLKNIRKDLERKARNKELQRQQQDSDDDDMQLDFEVKPQSKSIEEILAESDDDTDFEDMPDQKNSKSKKIVNKQAKAWIHENEDSLIDFTDPAAAKRITATDPRLEVKNGPATAKPNKNRGFKTAPDGRLIITEASDSEDEGYKKRGRNKKAIPDDSEDDENAEDAEDMDESSGGRFVLAPGNKRRRALSITSADALSEPTMKYQAGGSGIHRSMNNETQSKKMGHTGDEYKAKKAKGDMKKKGKLEPYAYVPLNSKLLNRRKHAKHAGQLQQLEISAKKGALKGSKARAKMLGKKRRK